MRKILILSLFLFASCVAIFAQKEPKKVACVGDSITFGVGVANPDRDSYPAKLQELLGTGYQVKRFGKPGATLLNRAFRPYVQQKEYKDALAFSADIVVIHLGVNDTDPRAWPNYRDDFISDYHKLIASFRKANPRCRVLIALTTPIGDRHPRFESGTRDWQGEIQEAITAVAHGANVQLFDFHTPLYSYPFLLPDAIHPNEEGAEVMAKTAYSAITGDFGGLKLSPLYTDNMVLQYGEPLTIQGTANANDKVTVTIDKQKQTATTDTNGHWKILLQPLRAGGPYTLTISAGKQTQTYANVLAGEVWLCSGQSNMEFSLKQSATGARDLPQSTNNNIRLFNSRERWRTDAVAWDKSALDSLNNLQHYKETTWQACAPNTADNFSAVAYYFGKKLQEDLGVPVGLICNAIGGSPTESWIDRHSLEFHFPAILRNWKKNDFIQDWARGRAALNIKKSTHPLQRHPYEPCYLYESGIRPLEQFPIKGVIWYQGESNAHNKDAHEKLFKLLVKSWRKNWKNEKLPFYFVQLSSLNRPSWPWFRDSQRRLMKEIPYTGMAVSSDRGDSKDVHPRFKQEIGERLAAWALNKTYNRKNITPSGPLFRSATFDASTVLVSFDYSEGMRSADGGAIRTFELAGSDQLFYPAQAKVVGKKIKVWSDKVKKPIFVRYGWQPFTDANLVNKAGFPASTFQSQQ